MKTLIRGMVVGILAVMTMGSVIPAEAHQTAPRTRHWAKHHPRRAETKHRQHKQHHRIKAGVKSGQLTRDEAKTLAVQQKAIRQERREMIKNDGKLDPAETKKLNQDMNAASQAIYNEKHDDEKR